LYKARRYSSWKVLQAVIEGTVIIDLINLDTFEEFERQAKKIQHRYKKTKRGRPRELLNAVVLNMMYKTKPYDIVRGVFPVPRKSAVNRTNIQPYEIQLSVRNRECINTDTIKEVASS